MPRIPVSPIPSQKPAQHYKQPPRTTTKARPVGPPSLQHARPTPSTARTSTALPTQYKKARVVIISISVAAITVLGAWYGADLKIGQEKALKHAEWVGAPVNERIEALEERRRSLERTRAGLIVKMDELKAKMRGENPEMEPIDGRWKANNERPSGTTNK